VIVGRGDQLRSFELLLSRLERGRTEQSMIITGLRGVGKTVLLNEFRKKAESRKWAAIEVEVSKHDNDYFRGEMAREFRIALFRMSPKARSGDKAKRLVAVIKSFTIGVDPDGRIIAGLDVNSVAEEGIADSGNLAADLTELFIAVGDAAADHKTGVILLLDEIQFLKKEQLEAIIAALHRTVQRQLPITMVGPGLPQIAELAGEAKSYAERLFKFPKIGILSEEEAHAALYEPAQAVNAVFDNDALELASAVTGATPTSSKSLDMPYGPWLRITGSRDPTSPPRGRFLRKSWTVASFGFDWSAAQNLSKHIYEPWPNLAPNPS
jgi:hypothetical protein